MAKRAILEEDDDTEPIEVREETRGRPTKYNAQLFPRQAKLLATRGATQHEIAEIFGVSTSTLKVWLARYPELSTAIQAMTCSIPGSNERSLSQPLAVG
jgi:hypothetical protein